ncbi:hypothetical protein PPA191_gp04 [Liberibacter phage P-PA19-1]|nr:hypothetical protein PPA191_gp04 [Liberibacter phage P-PA19-1]
MIRKAIMEKPNFEQTKSVTYWALGSKFVIPWDVEDPSRIHAEVEYSDGRVQELAISQDFDVDGLNAWLTVNNREGDFIRIFEGEKQTFKEYNFDSPRAPHNLVKESDLHPVRTRLYEIEEHIKGALAPTVDLTPLDTRIKALENKPVPATVDLTPLDTRIKALENKPSTTSDMRTLENRIKEVEPLKNHFANGDLNLRSTETNLYPSVNFKDKAGDTKAWLYAYDDNLILGLVKKDPVVSGKLNMYYTINLSLSKGITLGGKTIEERIKTDLTPLDTRIKALENKPSATAEIEKRLESKMLGLLRGRTAIKCAILGSYKALESIIQGYEIESWVYPSENSSGYLSTTAVKSLRITPSEVDKEKRWAVVGKTESYYGVWYYLQEIIDA